MSGFGTPAHLVRRYLGAVRACGLAPADQAWVARHLLPGEQALWNRSSTADQVHAHGVARQVHAALGPDVDRAVIAAALLHDIGKVLSPLGTTGRAVATVVALAVGRRRAAGWAGRAGLRGAVGTYLRHPRLGATALAMAGSDGLTVDWAAQHHTPVDRWTVPVAIGEALKAADDD